jgi:hypothetical protein
MLPGFRFLFAAIVLSMSVLIFGLGAAALLRAAHEQFASIPARRATPEPVFAQPSEPPIPTLALLRFEPPVAEMVPDNAAAVSAPESEAPAAPAVDAKPAEPEKLAALNPEEPAAAEPVKAEIPAEPAPVAQAATPATNDEEKVAAIPETPPPATGAASTAPEPFAEAPSLEGNIAATKIATLDGPAVTIEEPASAKTKSAKPVRSAIRTLAQRTRERRRLAARRAALQAQEAAARQQANPFAQPAAQPAVTHAKR